MVGTSARNFGAMPRTRSNAAKRKQAKDLYCRSGLQQQAIADILSVTEKTISKWKQADAWDRDRAAYATTKESELRRIYQQLAKLNSHIDERAGDDENMQGVPNSKEADVISKLSSAIRTLENDAGASATVDVAIAFVDWLSARNVNLAPLKDGKVSFVQLVHSELDIYIKGLFK